VDVTATGPGWQVVVLPNASGIIPGQPMTMFLKNMSGNNWSYVEAYVIDGPAQNNRWSYAGYSPQELGVNRFNSAVVDVPVDYAASGGGAGFAVYMTGAGTASFIIDAVTFGS
jgi:hypothetical protein